MLIARKVKKWCSFGFLQLSRFSAMGGQQFFHRVLYNKDNKVGYKWLCRLTVRDHELETMSDI